MQGGAEGKASTDKGEARETAMKVTIDIDCTPEEARAFLGLPDLGPAQRAYVEEFQKRMMASLGTMDPAAMAKAYASDHCPAVVEQAVQVHGGMGFTQEHDLHLFLKRAKATETTFGDGAANRERIAGLLGL